MNDLQLALIGIGGAFVALVWGYNRWQEYRHRKLAEKVFATEQQDVLMQEGEQESPSAAERVEPTFAEEPVDNDEAPETIVAYEAEPEYSEPLVAPVELERDFADEHLDCIVRFECTEPAGGSYLWHSQHQMFEKLERAVMWLGWDEREGHWTMIHAHSSAAFRSMRAVLQLADRRGAVSDAELSLFFNGIQRLADEFLAVADMPSRAEMLSRAETLDRFCASVDIQVGVNVISANGNAFAGTKLRGLAESSGLQLQDDGLFHALNETTGETLYTLGNLEPALFAADEMKRLSTHGITLSLDVPRVTHGTEAFAHMLMTAKKLATQLGGKVVDDNRAPLEDKSLELIRASIARFQHQMQTQGVGAGSPAALRLFH